MAATVIVTLTRRELLNFNVRRLFHWRSVGPTFLILFAAVVGWVSFQHGLPHSGRDWFALIIGGAGGAVAAFALLYLISLLRVLLLAGRVPGGLGRHEFTFVSDGLLEKTDANETLTKWGGAHAVSPGSWGLLIEIAPGLVHIVPRHTFADQNQYDEFCEQAKRLVRQRA